MGTNSFVTVDPRSSLIYLLQASLLILMVRLRAKAALRENLLQQFLELSAPCVLPVAAKALQDNHLAMNVTKVGVKLTSII